MGIFDGILICTDLDGTLLKNDKSVSKENFDAIEYFKSEGGYFTFITGRMPFTAGRVLENVHINAPFGCINGGGLYDPVSNKYIWNQPIESDVTELVKYIIDKVDGIGVQINTFDALYFVKDNEAMRYFRKATGAPKRTCEVDGVKEPIAKILFGDTDESKILRVKELLDTHPRTAEFDYIRSERMLYEILPKGSSKGAVLPRLADYLGIDKRRTVAVGDYNNDISMLAAAGVGIAVANAVDEVRAAADIVTVSNEENAIAKIIEDIKKGIISL